MTFAKGTLKSGICPGILMNFSSPVKIGPP
jgi:hypothetical protein